MTFTPPDTSLIIANFPQIKAIDLIDSGGFKAVYRANIGGTVEAFKLIEIPSYLGDPDGLALQREFTSRVRREVDVLQLNLGIEFVKLGSIALCESVINSIGYLAYSEEFVSGSDLWKLLESGTTKPSEVELRLLFVTLLQAIKKMWSNGIIHRDIKPKNVMKTSDPHRQFVLLDLGIAYSVREGSLTVNASDRLPLASYRYLAPEMMDPDFRDKIDYRTDLYTTAMTVYEYGAKAHPLTPSKEDMIRTISRALRKPPCPFSQFRGDLSVDFRRTIDQMLKKKPALRPSNLDALIKQFEVSQ